MFFDHMNRLDTNLSSKTLKMALKSNETSVLNVLRQREISSVSHKTKWMSIPSIQKRLNEAYNNVFQAVNNLTIAINSGKFDIIEAEISSLISKLFDTSSSPDNIFNVTMSKRQDREVFITLGGIYQILRLFHGPFGKSDARKLEASSIQRKSEFWNEVLVILREVAFTIPSLADRLFSDNDIIFLFTLLSHSTVFDNTVNLLEEIFNIRSETFQLGLVPNLYSLLSNLSVRQLAHVCRAISLLLFESEDKHILESSPGSLRSLELLQLRKDRMVRLSYTVEKNQFLMIDMPGFLEKLVLIMKVINYGPTLSQMMSHNISSLAPLVSDVLHNLTTVVSSEADWNRLRQLEIIGSGAKPISPGKPQTGTQSRQQRNAAGEDENMRELLEIFSPSPESNGVDMSSLFRIIRQARELGLVSNSILSNRSNVDFDEIALAMLEMDMMTSRRPNQRTQRSSRPPIDTMSPRAAVKELQFYSMFLVPHQVEILFVICSLLSGRKKIYVQKELEKIGLQSCFRKMYDRLSWDSPPFQGANPLDHIHGPGCECNPESAIRVQFLRLIHNFYDRDFIHNENKTSILTEDEMKWLLSNRHSDALVPLLKDSKSGLLSAVISSFLSEPCDSVYRFWLSSCIEAFLRGNSRTYEQNFVARGGILMNIVHNVKNVSLKPTFNLQTAFDLLGEIIKCNELTLDMLESALNDNNSFRAFMDVVMNNLVDSNVFVRSLFLTMEYVSDKNQNLEPFGDFSGILENTSYLEDSWVPFSPTPVSKLAIDLTINRSPPRSNSTIKSRKWSAGKYVQLDTNKKTETCMKESSVANSRSSVSLVPTHSISAITDGIKEAFQGIRDAASHLLSSSTSALMLPETVAQIRDETSRTCTAIFNITHTSPSASPERKPTKEISIEERYLSMIMPSSRDDEVEIQKILDSTPCTSAESLASSYMGKRFPSCDDLSELDDMEFITPPEQPKFPRQDFATSGLAVANSIKTTIQQSDASKDNSRAQVNANNVSPYSKISNITDASSSFSCEKVHRIKEDINSSKWDRSGLVDGKGWVIPDKLFRISLLLTQEREVILLRLISSITLRTINHENICCLNTALLILLLAQRRGQLGYVINKLKLLASNLMEEAVKSRSPHSNEDNMSEGLSDCEDIDEIESNGYNGASVKTNLGVNTSINETWCQDCGSTNVNSKFSQPDTASTCGCRGISHHGTKIYQGISASSSYGSLTYFNSASSTSGDSSRSSRSTKVMKNFRELLWFWREYYLRRGRDRLSIEFSSHIPFHRWENLVDILCADDGSTTSLISRPAAVPTSPYVRGQTKSRAMWNLP